jgi:hypothetical protein
VSRYEHFRPIHQDVREIIMSHPFGGERSRMSSASVSPQGFVVVRGRGYRPEQVDAYAGALSPDRDTERVLREHGERWDDVQAQMDNVRNSLMALTGQVALE